jgi:hypothetical protein
MKKNIAGKMSFYLIIAMSFCLFIAILLVKIARLTRAYWQAAKLTKPHLVRKNAVNNAFSLLVI